MIAGIAVAERTVADTAAAAHTADMVADTVAAVDTADTVADIAVVETAEAVVGIAAELADTAAAVAGIAAVVVETAAVVADTAAADTEDIAVVDIAVAAVDTAVEAHFLVASSSLQMLAVVEEHRMPECHQRARACSGWEPDQSLQSDRSVAVEHKRAADWTQDRQHLENRMNFAGWPAASAVGAQPPSEASQPAAVEQISADKYCWPRFEESILVPKSLLMAFDQRRSSCPASALGAPIAPEVELAWAPRIFPSPNDRADRQLRVRDMWSRMPAAPAW